MTAWDSAFGMGVVRFSRPLSRVGVLAIPDAVLNRRQRVESVCKVPLEAEYLRLLVPRRAVGVIIHRRCVVDRVEVIR
jgi:hypothetical protein